MLVAASFNDLVCQAVRVREDELVAARHLDEPVQAESARHPGVKAKFGRWQRNGLRGVEVAARRI